MTKYLFILLAALLFGCGKPKQQLNVFNWPDDLDPKVIADFERQFECRVTIDMYETVDSMLAKLAAGGDAVYDIVQPGNFSLPTLIKRGLLAPLRHENIPNLKNIDPQFMNPPFDPDSRYGVPHQWGSIGLLARRPKGQTIDETWGLLFDPTKQIGTFVLTEDPRFCIGAALQYKGYKMNSTNLKELAEARDLLIEAKKRSLGFATSTAARNRVMARDATLAQVYSSDAIAAQKEDPERLFQNSDLLRDFN